MKRLNSKYFIVTRGEEGMTIFYKDGKYKHIPTLAREVYDVTGAGDTVIAILTLCLSLNYDLEISAYLANLGAGVVVGKRGTAVVTQKELIDYGEKIKI
ncbi:MAG: PfkB family carbohydrate kinase, partial [Candidatus Hydrogenedentota bacterium]